MSKMSKLPLEYVKHILIELEFLIKQSAGISEEEFYGNEILKRAFVRSLEIIGEAAKKIEDGFKKQYPEIEWKNMARMRDKLIHHYFGVDYSIVWDVVKNEAPLLYNKLKKLES